MRGRPTPGGTGQEGQDGGRHGPHGGAPEGAWDPRTDAMDRVSARLEELIRRLESLERKMEEERAGEPGRGGSETAGEIRVGPLLLEHAARRAYLDGERLRLSPTEYRVLHSLASEAGRVVSYSDILRHAWGKYSSADTHCVKVYANRLRRKLRSQAGEDLGCAIETVRGFGYRLVAAA
ncbi:MAG: winged helix-turn-helix domain-containing protein [Chloroflexota bacterium]